MAEPIELPLATRNVLAKAATDLKLTPKQFAFASLIVSGFSQAEAYRRSYDTQCDNKLLYPQASVLVRNPKVAETVEQGRASLNLLRAEEGRRTRELIAAGCDAGLQALLDAGDYEGFAKLAKVAGTQRHVQAFAAVGPDTESRNATDLADAISSFTSELSQSGIRVIDIEAVAQSQQIMQAVDSTSERVFRVMPMYELAECAGGGSD